MYKLTCPDCHRAYIGQTGRRFSTRYKEHETAFRHNPNTSSFAKHLTEYNHSFGPMPSIMQPLQFYKKGPHLNTLEKFHIYTESKANNHRNDDHTITTNAIFDTLARSRLPKTLLTHQTHRTDPTRHLKPLPAATKRLLQQPRP